MTTVRTQLVAVLALAVMAASACSQASTDSAPVKDPFELEEFGSEGLSRIRLERSAFDRIAIETSKVREQSVGASSWKVIDYSAVVYLPSGETATYTNPEGRVFVRAPIDIERVEGDIALLTDGPPVGMSVVKVGGAELMGMEFGVGK